MMRMTISTRRAPLIRLVRATWRAPLGLMPVTAAIATMRTTTPSQPSQVMPCQHIRSDRRDPAETVTLELARYDARSNLTPSSTAGQAREPHGGSTFQDGSVGDGGGRGHRRDGSSARA